MKKHNLNDFVAAIAHGSRRVAYNINTGEMYTTFAETKIDLVKRWPQVSEGNAIKQEVLNLIALGSECLMEDEYFIVYERDANGLGDWWSFATININTNGN